MAYGARLQVAGERKKGLFFFTFLSFRYLPFHTSMELIVLLIYLNGRDKSLFAYAQEDTIWTLPYLLAARGTSFTYALL